MVLNILLVDEAGIASIQKGTIEQDLGCHVDCTEDIEQARKLMGNNSYQALIIEPFERGTPLNPRASRVVFIREAREKNIPVIISSIHNSDILLGCYGLVRDIDYQEFFEKPYFFEDISSDLRKIVENKLCVKY